jgi:hypothetical protein
MTIQYLGTILFALALLHTFCVSYFAKLSHKYPKGSAAESFFHLLAEVEVVFGFCGGVSRFAEHDRADVYFLYYDFSFDSADHHFGAQANFVFKFGRFKNNSGESDPCAVFYFIHGRAIVGFISD